MSVEQYELFPMPSQPRRPRASRARRDGQPRYQRYRTRERVLCDECVMDIHARGVAVAPLPAQAKYQRIAADESVMRLCQRHTDGRQLRND